MDFLFVLIELFFELLRLSCYEWK